MVRYLLYSEQFYIIHLTRDLEKWCWLADSDQANLLCSINIRTRFEHWQSFGISFIGMDANKRFFEAFLFVQLGRYVGMSCLLLEYINTADSEKYTSVFE